jgi:ABC-type transport system involved in cytochrome c biogenesis permease subunit
MPIERITVLCFAASYAVAFLFELLHGLRPRPIQRLLAIAFGSAGLLAQTLFLAVQWPALASQSGSLLFLSWILAVFYLYGSVHHRRLAWGVFVLPVVIGLSVLAGLFNRFAGGPLEEPPGWPWDGEAFWRLLHVALFVLAAVGICVGFVASVMYLAQAQRLKSKALPGQGLRLLSLERLEEMNRRAIILAFPLLTAGLLVGLIRMAQPDSRPQEWTDPRILSTFLLWLVFVLVLYLRYGVHLRGRRLALLTILAFALLLVTLVTSHTGGGP